MRVWIIPVALLLAACAAPPPPEHAMAASELAGRSPGAPERCVSLIPADSLRPSDTDRHTLIYGNGATVWANRLGQCAFGNGDVLVTEPTGPYYCRGDLVRSFDRTSHIPGPTCVLGEFIPYRR